MMRGRYALALLVGASVSTGIAGTGCAPGEATATYARRIDSTKDLIGGPSALGTTGDWIIGNQKIRVIIQDQGWSRGFGIFGGGIIDADIVRPGLEAETGFGNGRDNFGEFFPALFLQAFDVSDQEFFDVEGNQHQLPAIEVLADGSDGGPARIITRATGGDFITMVATVLSLAVPAGDLRFETEYVLFPEARHLEIIGRVINVRTNIETHIPSDLIGAFLELVDISGLQIPLGDIALFGDGNKIFAPGAVQRSDRANPKTTGFDLRFAVEATYENPPSLPALPGLIVDFLATAGDDVSYGIAVADSENNFVWQNRDQYSADNQASVTRHSMVVPFLISSFTGVFYELPPAVLGPGESYEYKKYFIVGDGDVASIRNELFEIRGTKTGDFFGTVLNAQSGTPAADTSVHIYDWRRRPYNHVDPDADGRFRCRLEPGTYYWIVTGPGRFPYTGGPERFSVDNQFVIRKERFVEEEEVRFEIHGAQRTLYPPRPATLIVNVRDTAGRKLPAKVSALLPYRVPKECAECTEPICDDVCAPRKYLFDFSLGEHRRSTDLNWRDGPGKRDGEFVEEVLFTVDGTAQGPIRPSPCTPIAGEEESCVAYDIYVSRGLEYDIEIIRGVILREGEVRQFAVTLEKVLETENYVGADFHIHARPSADSYLALDDRVISGAAEGLDLLVATDHNVITDYAPTIAALGLQDWVTSMVGVELTTLEMGHFNAFPMRNDAASPSHFPFVDFCRGDLVEDETPRQRQEREQEQEAKVNETAFEWVPCTPQELFDNLRRLGKYGGDDTIVQVNHPRDNILGYFNQYFVSPYALEAEIPAAENYFSFVNFIRPVDDPDLNNFLDPALGRFAPRNFSWDFDAIEVFNGKRHEMLHAFRTPLDAPQDLIDSITDVQCGDGHPSNERGRLLVRPGGYVRYPGAFDDWLRLLNRGFKFTGTANSDSHRLSAEIGNPRTYVYVRPHDDGSPRDDRPGLIHELDIVEGLRTHRAIGTNGPFLQMTVLTKAADQIEGEEDVDIRWPIGRTVLYAESNVGREVVVLFRLQSAPWVDIDRIVVYANSLGIRDGEEPFEVEEPLDVIEIQDEKLSDGRDVDDDSLYRRVYVFNQDTVLVAVAEGSRSLFPVVTPKENPPANISAAIGAILSSFGTGAFGANDGIAGPSYVQRATPFAFTNPIWLDIEDPQCVAACTARGGSADCQMECPPNGVFDPPGNLLVSEPAPVTDQDKEPPFCGLGNTCLRDQICDTNQSPPRCTCPETSALLAGGQRVTGPGALHPFGLDSPNAHWFAPPQPGQHFRRADIRKLFAEVGAH